MGGVLRCKQKSARKFWFRTKLHYNFGEVQYQHHAFSKSGLELNRQPGDSKTKQQYFRACYQNFEGTSGISRSR
jgi:hypothetical protein